MESSQKLIADAIVQMENYLATRPMKEAIYLGLLRH